VLGCNRSFHALGQADHRASMPIREMGAMADVQSNNPAQRMSLVGSKARITALQYRCPLLLNQRTYQLSCNRAADRRCFKALYGDDA
jgi:hypothetical protein